MLHAFRSEWVKLGRARFLLGILGAVAAFTVLATVITITTAGQPGAGPGDATSPADLAASDGVVAGLGSAVTFLGIIALSVAAYGVASEYQHGTLRTLLVRQPARLKLLGGTTLALGSLLVVMAAALATIVSAATALVVAPGQDVDTGAWSAGAVPAGFGEVAVALLGYGLIGGFVGLLPRSPVAAIGVGVAWVLPVETILGAISSSMDDILPGQLLSAIAGGSASGADVLVACTYPAIAATAAALAFARRDVSA